MSPHPEPPPQFEGHCAFAVSLGKMDVPGKPACHAVRDGKTYFFSNRIARFLWSMLPGVRAKAEANWRGR